MASRVRCRSDHAQSPHPSPSPTGLWVDRPGSRGLLQTPGPVGNQSLQSVSPFLPWSQGTWSGAPDAQRLLQPAARKKAGCVQVLCSPGSGRPASSFSFNHFSHLCPLDLLTWATWKSSEKPRATELGCSPTPNLGSVGVALTTALLRIRRARGNFSRENPGQIPRAFVTQVQC